MLREKRREDEMRELTGYRMMRFIWADLFDPQRTQARLQAVSSAPPEPGVPGRISGFLSEVSYQNAEIHRLSGETPPRRPRRQPSCASMAPTSAGSSGTTPGLKRATTEPEPSTRNFSKFQVTSPASPFSLGVSTRPR